MVVSFYGLTKAQKLWLKQRYPRLVFQAYAGVMTLDNLPSPKTEILSVPSDCHINSLILKQLPNLKLIITRTAGLDHIDLAACHRAKVSVANNPGLNAIAVAEFTMGLVSNYFRQIPDCIAIGGQLKFNDNLIGRELFGKTIGIVGTGAIGSHVARIAKGFGMELLGYDAKKNLKAVKQLGLRYLGLKQLVQKADVITLHVPATPLTEQMINRTLLTQVKPGAVLVNTARGSVIDVKAVLAALDKGRLGAYLADVVQNEHQLRTHPRRLSPRDRLVMKLQQQLAKHPKVWLTPHVAHATQESSERILANTAQLIEDFSRGKKIPVVL